MSSRQGTHPVVTTRTAGDRCACCHSLDLPRYYSHAPDEAQAEGSVTCALIGARTRLTLAAARKAEECVEFTLICQCEP